MLHEKNACGPQIDERIDHAAGTSVVIMSTE
jgi:hypothetical protein